MRPNKIQKLILTLCFSLISAICNGWPGAGGPILYEGGTPDMGTAYAGSTARAQDASTAFLNPAGLSNLTNNYEVVVAAMGGYLDLEFEVNQANTIGVPANAIGGGGKAGPPLFGAGFYLSGPGFDKWRAGLTINSLYGGSVKYREGWLARNFVRETSVLALNIEPALSYQLNDKISIGAGLNLVYFYMPKFVLSALPTENPPMVELKDASDWDTAISLGLLWKITENTRLGLSYRSELKASLEGDLTIPQGTVGSFVFNTKLPQGANLGLYHKYNSCLELMADVGFTQWSKFSYQNITLNNSGTVDINRDWKNAWQFGLGLNYKLNNLWKLKLGARFDTDPAEATRLYPDVPVSEAYRLAAGFKYKLKNNYGLHTSFTWLHFSDIKADRVSLPWGVVMDGKYDSSSAYMLGVALSFKEPD